MRVLIAGADGQLGQALVHALGGRVVWSGGRVELDVGDASRVRERVLSVRPDVVVNAAAYNNVDGAEANREAAFRVNAEGPQHLAEACAEAGALLVHVSTDYVFDGRKGRPYLEDDPPGPLSAYGESKRAGELAVTGGRAAHLLVRTSGVLGFAGSRVKGGSFVERILARARSGAPLRVVADQVFAPTYAPDLAATMVSLIACGARGIVHVTNEGACTWHELACSAIAEAGVAATIAPITSAELGAVAARPAFSVLDTSLLRSLGHHPRPWRDALRELIATLTH